MASQVTYPGVYIVEFAPGAPIEGVGTSTPAFIGPATKGELDQPTKITSWDQFRTTFGEFPLPGFYLWYAVRGFFENDGQVCYVVRASNGAYAEAVLLDNVAAGTQHDLIHVRARQPGNVAMQVTITHTHLLDVINTELYRPASTFTATAAREVELPAIDQAAQFRPDDVVDLQGIGERRIARISGLLIRLTEDLNVAVGTAGNIRLANTPVGARTLRLQTPAVLPAGSLATGAMLTISQGVNASSQIVDSVQTENLLTTPSITTHRVTFRDGLSFPVDMTAQAFVRSEEFRLEVDAGGIYENLSVDPSHSRYYANVINRDPDALVTVTPVEPPTPAQPPENLPEPVATPLANGLDEDVTLLNAQDYIDAIATLEEIDDVNLVAVPDAVTLQLPSTPQMVQQAAVAHCEQKADRFAVIDAEANRELFGAESIEVQRLGLDSTRGYAALYYPWLRVRPFGAGAPILVPPSGHVCGIIARSDNSRGVHKAPANEIVKGSLGVQRTMSNVDQGQLNIQGINVIRQFQSGGRPYLWGARTTATDRNWQYVNIRRLFLFLEESIQEGIRWAVFEPHNQSLWQKLNRSITDFLTRVWRDGALFGETAEDAFYVRIDETLNPDSERSLGRLHIEIGVRPSYPAEFIIVRIGIWQGGSEVTEG